MINQYIAMIIASIFIFSIDDFFAKRLSSTIGNFRTALYVLGIGLLPLLPFAIVSFHLSAHVLAVSLIAAIFMSMGFIFFYKSLETQQISNASALFEMQPIIFVLFGIFAFGEHVGFAGLAAIAVILAGAIMLMLESGLRFNKALIPALSGIVIFAFYLIALEYLMGTGSGVATPLFISRAGAFAIVLAYMLLFENKGKRANATRLGNGWRYAAIAGITDGTGYLLVLIVFFANMMSVGGAILALNPILTAALGVHFYKEKLAKAQLAGFALVIAGAVALSIV